LRTIWRKRPERRSGRKKRQPPFGYGHGHGHGHLSDSMSDTDYKIILANQMILADAIETLSHNHTFPRIRVPKHMTQDKGWRHMIEQCVLDNAFKYTNVQEISAKQYMKEEE